MQTQETENRTIFLTVLREIAPSVQRLSDEQIIKKAGKERIDDAVADVFAYLDSGVNGELNKNERIALLTQTMKCLSLYMKQSLDIPVTLTTILENLHKLGFAVDKCFPMYAQSKLLKYVILSRVA